MSMLGGQYIAQIRAKVSSLRAKSPIQLGLLPNPLVPANVGSRMMGLGVGGGSLGGGKLVSEGKARIAQVRSKVMSRTGGMQGNILGRNILGGRSGLLAKMPTPNILGRTGAVNLTPSFPLRREVTDNPTIGSAAFEATPAKVVDGRDMSVLIE